MRLSLPKSSVEVDIFFMFVEFFLTSSGIALVDALRSLDCKSFFSGPERTRNERVNVSTRYTRKYNQDDRKQFYI